VIYFGFAFVEPIEPIVIHGPSMSSPSWPVPALKYLFDQVRCVREVLGEWRCIRCSAGLMFKICGLRRSDVKLGTCKHCCNIINILYSRTNFITTAFATKRPRFQDYQIPGMRSCNRNENQRKASRYVKICTTGILSMTGPLKSLEYVWTCLNHVNICMKSPRKSTTNL